MITVHQHGNNVRLSIESGLKTEGRQELWFYWDCKDPLFAELLTDDLRKKIQNRIEAIRKEEYERGFKDAKAKRRKATWWSCTLKLIYSN